MKNRKAPQAPHSRAYRWLLTTLQACALVLLNLAGPAWALTGTTATLTGATPNPSAVNQSVTFTASVTGASNPTGTVTFKTGSGTTLGTATLNAGVASVSYTFTSAASRNITAKYNGDTLNAASNTSALVHITQAGAPPAALPPVPVSPPPVVNYEYDAQGNPTRTIQAPGVSGFNLESKASYDPLYRVKDATDPQLGKTQFQYDGGDRTTRVQDPRSLVTQYPRDGLGQATQLISPGTGTASHTFDAAGNLKTRTDSRGVLTTHTYDALNRLTQSAYTKTGMTSQSFGWAYDQTGTGYANGWDG